MKLQTNIEITPPDFSIHYESKLLLLGSCFAENIGEKLKYYKFDADINPCGIVYNPFSVANVLELLLDNKRFTPEDLLHVNGKWISLSHHGSFSDQDQTRCLEKINARLSHAASNIGKNDLLIITWGTAWVYHHEKAGKIVANCHKIPSQEFHRYRLTVHEIVERYTSLIQRLRENNPRLRVLFTVSPIRHWKDGAHGNQLSKAVLLLAIEELQKRVEQIYYFPAYEIVLDELRDYRFYTDDMLHISPFAINYIWERLLANYIHPHAMEIMERVDRVQKGIAHRPFNPTSSEHLHATQKWMAEIKRITEICPSIDFSEENSRLTRVLELIDDRTIK